MRIIFVSSIVMLIFSTCVIADDKKVTTLEDVVAKLKKDNDGATILTAEELAEAFDGNSDGARRKYVNNSTVIVVGKVKRVYSTDPSFIEWQQQSLPKFVSSCTSKGKDSPDDIGRNDIVSVSGVVLLDAKFKPYHQGGNPTIHVKAKPKK